MKCEINALHRAFNSHTRYLTITLQGMTIAYREQRFRNRNRKIQCATRHQLFAIHISTAEARWDSGMDARLRRRHAHDTHEGAQCECMFILIATSHRMSIESPV